MKMKKIIFFALSLISLKFIAQQQINKTLFFDGSERSYIVYIPEIYDESESAPLLLNFHGGSGTSTGFLNYENDMRPIADTANFIAVYPQALEDPNDGNSTNWIHKDPTTHNDINFVNAILDELNEEFNIDNSRIYACGYSLGGEFTFELVCNLNNRIAAASSVARTMQQYTYDNCSPIHPTAIQTILGTNDQISPYNGLTFGGVSYYISADLMHEFWSNYNNTDINPITNSIADINSSDGSTVDRRRWENGNMCVSVEELRINGGGHDWPGSFGNMDINASQEIWKFLSRYNLNGLIGCQSLSQKIMNSKFVISPNPVITNLTIRKETTKTEKYSVISTLGNTVINGSLDKTKNIINLSKLKKGLYIIKIGNSSYKIYKEI